ncbi:MAG: hypothetical protein CVT73_23175 [Alphaproteobacteria bacterium HGW-Alphaproteobacteria-12]|nr:MAG: hypothetical protein CVT73_23175 [Alphaproteobacteria bacterium HGW-Alphaproteobacteria-12]
MLQARFERNERREHRRRLTRALAAAMQRFFMTTDLVAKPGQIALLRAVDDAVTVPLASSRCSTVSTRFVSCRAPCRS